MSREPDGTLARRTRMSQLSPRSRAFLAALSIVLAGALAGCGSSSPDSATDPGEPPGTPPAASTPDAPVSGFGMVLDKGDGPQLCLGAIAESYPPQCGGIPLDGWDWSARDDFEDISGVKFAMYAVTGTFDGTRLTVTEPPISGALYDPMPDPTVGRGTSTICPEPDGGWAVTDRDRANANALVEAEQAAFALEGYVTHWTDQFSGLEISVPEDISPDPDPEMGDDGTLDPLRLVLNVQVSGSVTDATSAMEQVWGGALCVTNPRHTDSELNDIASDLAALDHVLGTVPQFDRVLVDVIYDNGDLQAYADRAYGEGTVVVMSALR